MKCGRIVLFDKKEQYTFTDIISKVMKEGNQWSKGTIIT